MAAEPMQRVGEERRRRSTVDGPRGSPPRGHGVRVLARLRPLVSGEEEPDIPCVRMQPGGTQLEVLLEPRALLTDSVSRNRRRTIGTIPNGYNTRSAATLNDTARNMGLVDSSSSNPGTRDLESRTFSFDKVFDASVSDDQVFDELQDELKGALDGEAVCILAYGATGSGKTHTVTNLAERAARQLDQQAESLELTGLRLEITVQIVEIYNEQFRDLLSQDTSQQEPPKLKMSTPTSNWNLQGVNHRVITRDGNNGIMKSLQAALRFGQAQRATSSTSVHGRSSRSHLVMMLYLATQDPATGRRTIGRLSLVDLAGSERIKSSEATGDRLKEAQHINRSLSALADVVVAKEKGVAHVPYRNSKLTHLLQDALGGQQNSRTVIIVALPPTRMALGETLHSLQLSSRLNSIAVQKGSRNSLYLQLPGGVPDEEALRMEAERLRTESARVRSREELVEERERNLEERERELEEMKNKLEALRILKEEELRAIGKVFSNDRLAGIHSSSPPSPVMEVDSSVEKSAELDKAWESTAEEGQKSPSSDELHQPQPEPELQPADDLDELSTSQAEAEKLMSKVDEAGQLSPEKMPNILQAEASKQEDTAEDTEGLQHSDSQSVKDPEVEESPVGTVELDASPTSPASRGAQRPSLSGSSGSWKWADPREQENLLPSVPSPARRRSGRSSVPPSPSAFCEEQGSSLMQVSCIEHPAEEPSASESDIAVVLPRETEAETAPSFQPVMDGEEDELTYAVIGTGAEKSLSREGCKESQSRSLLADEAFVGGTSGEADVFDAGQDTSLSDSVTLPALPTLCREQQQLRSRSRSARSPKEYIVEEISPKYAKELTKRAKPWTTRAGDPAEDSLDEEFSGGKTPFLMLSSPLDDTSEGADSPSHFSCGGISESSDEADIKDRLTQVLQIKPKQEQSRRPQMTSYVRGAGSCSPSRAGAPTPCHSHPGPAIPATGRASARSGSHGRDGPRAASASIHDRPWSSYHVPPLQRLGSPLGTRRGAQSLQPNPSSVAAAAAAAAASGNLTTPRPGCRTAEALGGSKVGYRSASSSPRAPVNVWTGAAVRQTSSRSPGPLHSHRGGFAQTCQSGSSMRATTPRVAVATHASSNHHRTPQRVQPYMASSLVSNARTASSQIARVPVR
eukprot:TRINITY_DN4790_c0_g1_i1.p1 TRINITY_DN4790_c0_g1~~TRINITY_DN4790_c0_g1_i1.p1  ORF type:complete len:1159 (+),score=219.94 TRINITY_DN4790_c0_g1_i1:44-3478(+)